MRATATSGLLTAVVLVVAPPSATAQEHAHGDGERKPAPCMRQDDGGHAAVGKMGEMDMVEMEKVGMGMGHMDGAMGMMVGVQDTGPMAGHASAMMAARTGILTPRALLWQKAALGLSDDQVRRLERLDQRLVEAGSAYEDAVRQIRGELEPLRSKPGEPIDVSRFDSLLGRLAQRSVQRRVEAARIGNEALDVLTREQRSNVRYGLELMGGMMQEKAGGGMMQMMQECTGGGRGEPGDASPHHAP